MDLESKIAVIDQMIAANRQATVGDYARVMARMEPGQRKLSGPLMRLIWPHLSNPGRRRWPQARIYDPRSLFATEEESREWRIKNAAFTNMLKRTNLQKRA